MTAMDHFLYNSLSKSLKYDRWQLCAISITIPYQNYWNMTYDCQGPFPSQLLIKIIEVRPMSIRGYFLYKSLWKSLKYNTWLLDAISFAIPCQNHWLMIARSDFLYNPLSKLMKCDLWLSGAISFTQLLIKIIEMWPMTDRDNFLDNSLTQSMRYDLWLLRAISFTIPYENNWSMTYDC